MGFSYSTEFDEGTSVDTIPPPASFSGDQEVPNGEPDTEQHQVLDNVYTADYNAVYFRTHPSLSWPHPQHMQVWDNTELEKSFQTKEELSDFFKTLSRGATPDQESADVSTTDQPPSEQLLLPPQDMHPYHFKGNRGNVFASPALDRVKEAEIYATLPRNKSHSKTSSPASASPCVTPLGHHSPKKHLLSSTQTHSRSAARRAEGFSELLQFTRQQQCSPLGDMDVSQSLPFFTSGQLLQEKLGTPTDNLIEDGAGQTRHDPSVNTPQPDGVVVRESGEATPEMAISPPLDDSDDDEGQEETAKYMYKGITSLAVSYTHLTLPTNREV